MRTTGFFSKYLDNKYGIGFADLEKLSVRQQREIITARAKQVMKETKLRHKFDHKASSRSRVLYSQIDQYPMGPVPQFKDPIEKRRVRAKSNATLQSTITPLKTTDATTTIAANRTTAMQSPMMVN